MMLVNFIGQVKEDWLEEAPRLDKNCFPVTIPLGEFRILIILTIGIEQKIYLN